MTIRARTARSFCTKQECKLFDDSRHVPLNNWSVKQLQKREALADKLLHKAREAADVQPDDIGVREKHGAHRRVAVLDEVRGRLARRMKHALMEMVGREEPKPGKPRASVPSGPKGGARARVRRLARVKQSRFDEAPNQRIQGHGSSRDRRKQIDRDNKY